MIKRKPAGGGPSGEAPARRGNGSGSGQPAQLSVVRELARIAAEFELDEIEFEPQGRIRISRRDRAAAQAGFSAASAASSLSPLAVVPHPPAPALAAADEGLFITSPFVGTFYRSPSPEAAMFVEVGKEVRKGQVVCIIEAMKLMNEIESEVDGTVSAILVKNGEHVEYGQPLFRLAKA